MVNSRHYIVYTDKKGKNSYIIKEFFPLDVVLEVLPKDTRRMQEYDFIAGQNVKYYATISNDSRYVAILVKEENGKHYFLLEIITMDEFTVKYKTISQ